MTNDFRRPSMCGLRRRLPCQRPWNWSIFATFARISCVSGMRLWKRDILFLFFIKIGYKATIPNNTQIYPIEQALLGIFGLKSASFNTVEVTPVNQHGVQGQ